MKFLKNDKKISCLTIASKNYISYVRVLCRSFLDNHPGASFYVVLVDENNGYIDTEKEDFILIEMEDIGLPRPDIFPYQYNILELNTSVKPFAMKYLLNNFEIDKLVYIDPDIEVFSSLSKVWGALDFNSIVLTPHIREPFRDKSHPSELSIIQSGTYNLGFIGIKNNDTGLKLLNWWSERLYLNCVVDISRGLFTDQKWIDLVPAYFEDVFILHSPEYNVAYWNLHERDVTKEGDDYFVDGLALAFFHFSGYNPLNPRVLSKHQNRHSLEDDNDILLSLFNRYRDSLFDADFQITKDWPYAYGRLPNGIKTSDPIHRVIRSCLENHVFFPSPSNEVDSFCNFLMTPNRNYSGREVAPIVTEILSERPDVRAVFPCAEKDNSDPGFLEWLRISGESELKLGKLSDSFELLTKKGSVKAIADIYHSRSDLMIRYPKAYISDTGFEEFQEWVFLYGVNEYDFLSKEDCVNHFKAKSGVHKVLNLFFGRLDLQGKFANFGDSGVIDKFRDWCLGAIRSLANISVDEVEFFSVWAKHNGSYLSKVNLANNAWIRDQLGMLPNVFGVERLIDFCQLIKLEMEDSEIITWLVSEYNVSPIQHIASYFSSDAYLYKKFPDAIGNKEEMARLFNHLLNTTNVLNHVDDEWVIRAEQEIQRLNEFKEVCNLVGYFNASTGMGESARSMLRIMDAGKKKSAVYSLPNVYTTQASIELTESGLIFGESNLLAGETIIIANADSAPCVNDIYPAKFCEGKKIGFWVWETEKLPTRWAKNADYYDEIWSPSEYSAKAIEKTVKCAVRVVPHVVNYSDLENLRPDRPKFKLPERGFIFGYFFDQKSYLERKNPHAVIDSFDMAFSDNAEVYLLMKVSTPLTGDYAYEQLKARSNSMNIIWIEEELSREDAYSLMASIDAYVSLHRSEGFGLTMAEAMALGKPVVATGYSGNLQFMNSKNSYLVATDRVNIGLDIGPYKKTCFWGEPSVVDASKKMKKLYMKYKENKIINNESSVVVPSLSDEFVYNNFIETNGKINAK